LLGVQAPPLVDVLDGAVLESQFVSHLKASRPLANGRRGLWNVLQLVPSANDPQALGERALKASGPEGREQLLWFYAQMRSYSGTCCREVPLRPLKSAKRVITMARDGAA
jgi:hypothetical protein